MPEMKTISSMSPIDAKKWMDLTYKTQIINRICGDHYSKAYPILFLYFKGISTEVSWDNLILGLHVVYGWMPTIPQLKKVMDWPLDKRVLFVNTLKEIISEKNASVKQFELIKEFSNNSVVGASKLLHFLVPETFPIWDSRVAKAFFSRKNVSYNQINKPSIWQTYTNTLLDWIKNDDVKKRCKELRRNSVFLKDVSDIRMVELVLFHKTKSNKK